MPAGHDITTAGGIADLVPLDGLPAGWPARSPTAARRSSSTATRSRRCSSASTGPCSTRPSWSHLQEVTGARIVQRTRGVRTGPPVRRAPGHLVGRPGWTDRPTAAALLDALRQCAPDLDPGRRPRYARSRRALAVAGSRRGHDRRPRGGLRVGVDGRGHEVPRAEAVDHQPRSTSRRCSPRCSSTTWRRSSTARRQRRVPRRRPAVERGGRGCASTATAACAIARPSASATTTRRPRSPSSATTVP